MSFAAPGFAHTFELADFKPGPTRNSQWTTPFTAAPVSGDISVTVTLVGPGGAWQGDASFALNSGTRWMAFLLFDRPPGDANPSFECRGCLDQVSFPIPRELVRERSKWRADISGMSLWIVWSRLDVS
ncbi:MAG: hypothetical protein ACE5HQ_14165 [Gemmatimonadota bacterium]